MTEQIKRRLIKVGDSQAVVIPPAWLRAIQESTGRTVKEISLSNGDTFIKIHAIIDDSVYILWETQSNASWFSEIKRRLISETSGECNNCHGRFTADKLILHHSQPVKEGGKNNIDNLELLCAACHNARHNVFGVKGIKDKGLGKEKVNTTKMKSERIDITDSYLAKYKREKERGF